MKSGAYQGGRGQSKPKKNRPFLKGYVQNLENRSNFAFFPFSDSFPLATSFVNHMYQEILYEPSTLRLLCENLEMLFSVNIMYVYKLEISISLKRLINICKQMYVCMNEWRQGSLKKR